MSEKVEILVCAAKFQQKIKKKNTTAGEINKISK